MSPGFRSTLTTSGRSSRSEGESGAELHLKRVRNRGRGGESTQVPDGLVVRGRLIRPAAVLVPEVGAVQDVVELGEDRQLPGPGKRDVFRHPCVCVEEWQP